jgi:hypothetical protein
MLIKMLRAYWRAAACRRIEFDLHLRHDLFEEPWPLSRAQIREMARVAESAQFHAAFD